MKATIAQVGATKYFEQDPGNKSFFYGAERYLVEFKMPHWDTYVVAYTLYVQATDGDDEACDIVGTSDTGDHEETFDPGQVLDWRVYQLLDI